MNFCREAINGFAVYLAAFDWIGSLVADTYAGHDALADVLGQLFGPGALAESDLTPQAVAVYAHYKKIARSQADGLEITKSNVLLVGPTGTGKTLVCESLARLLKVPFVTADATSLAQSRFVNDEIEAILERLHDKA